MEIWALPAIGARPVGDPDEPAGLRLRPDLALDIVAILRCGLVDERSLPYLLSATLLNKQQSILTEGLVYLGAKKFEVHVVYSERRYWERLKVPRRDGFQIPLAV